MSSRYDVHGIRVHDDCPDPTHCACECLECKRVWEAAGRPRPAATREPAPIATPLIERAGPVTTDDERATVHERHAGEWHEWSIGDKAPPPGAPHEPAHRLFVRVDGMIEIILARVTSYAPGARELDGHQADGISLTSSDVRWLLDVLPRALALKEAELKAGEP